MRNPQVSSTGAYPMLNILPLDATIVQLDPDAGMLASDVIEDAGQEMGCHTLVGGQSNHASKQLRTRWDNRVGKPEDLACLGDGAGPDLRWRRACSGTVQQSGADHALQVGDRVADPRLRAVEFNRSRPEAPRVGDCHKRLEL